MESGCFILVREGLNGFEKKAGREREVGPAAAAAAAAHPALLRTAVHFRAYL